MTSRAVECGTSYLKRDVSTVQRWEKREGMPVHRHRHDKLGSVYAFPNELDAWWQSRQMRLRATHTGATEIDEGATEAREAPVERAGRRRFLWLTAALGVVALAVALVWLLERAESFWQNPCPTPDSFD